MNDTERDFCFEVMVKRLEERYNRDAEFRQEIRELNGRLLAACEQNRRMTA